MVVFRLLADRPKLSTYDSLVVEVIARAAQQATVNSTTQLRLYRSRLLDKRQSRTVIRKASELFASGLSSGFKPCAPLRQR